MPTVGILTDTTASIPEKMITQLGIRLVPYFVHHGLETLRDMVDIQPDEFVAYLRQAVTLPTTANPSPGDYLAALLDMARDTTEIVALTMTSKGSGAYQSCKTAVEMLREKMPEVQVEVVDTLRVAMSHGWAAVEAARAATQGLRLREVAGCAREVARKATMIMTADTLRYLYMGGRIGRAQHLVGSLLNIKPLIGIEQGAIVALGAARTRPTAYARIVQIAQKFVGEGAKVRAAFTHVGAPEEAGELRRKFESAIECVEVITNSLSPALAVHSGPGTVGVSFFPV
jgi:DegV family protein with EDD domain